MKAIVERYKNEHDEHWMRRFVVKQGDVVIAYVPVHPMRPVVDPKTGWFNEPIYTLASIDAARGIAQRIAAMFD